MASGLVRINISHAPPNLRRFCASSDYSASEVTVFSRTPFDLPINPRGVFLLSADSTHWIAMPLVAYEAADKPSTDVHMFNKGFNAGLKHAERLMKSGLEEYGKRT